MRHNPKPYHQLLEERLLIEGKGKFEIIKGEEKTSKSSGKSMWEFSLRALDGRNKSGLISYFIMLDDEDLELKLYNLYHSCGRGALFFKNDIYPAELVGGKGDLIIGIVEDKEGKYAPKNVVRKLIVPTEYQTQLNDSGTKEMTTAPFNDDVPF